MLVIRLARTGRRNQPKFRVVVAEHSKPVKSNVVEVVGHYNPTVKKDPLSISKEAIEAWLGKGAQPSNTVSRLLNKHAGFNLDVKQRPARKPKAELKKDASGEGEKAEKPAPADAGSSKPTEGEAPTEEKPAEKPVDKPEAQSGVADEVKTEEPVPEAKPEPPVEEPTTKDKPE